MVEEDNGNNGKLVELVESQIEVLGDEKRRWEGKIEEENQFEK